MEISKNKRPAAEPAKNYKEKYEHLIGKESALDAAKKTVTNKSYGFGELIYYVHARIYYHELFVNSALREQKGSALNRANVGGHARAEKAENQSRRSYISQQL